MDQIGSIAGVVSDRHVLVRSEKSLSPNTELIVFGRLSPPKVQELYGLSHLDIPKGKIRILSHQNGDLYLAERFRMPGQQQRRFIASPFSGNLLSELLKGKEEVVEIPGPWSADFDLANSLDIKFDRQIKAGDFVSFS